MGVDREVDLWWDKGLVRLWQGRKVQIYRLWRLEVPSWVALIPLRNLFVPVSRRCLKKAPHILWFFLLDILPSFLYIKPIPKRVLIKTGTHFFHPGMPRTNSLIEGIIRNLSRKIDDTDGFESLETAWHSLKLLIMNYRFHPFSCSRNKSHNGLSPLELAGVDISHINWVEFSQRKFISN